MLYFADYLFADYLYTVVETVRGLTVTPMLFKGLRHVRIIKTPSNTISEPNLLQIVIFEFLGLRSFYSVHGYIG